MNSLNIPTDQGCTTLRTGLR